MRYVTNADGYLVAVSFGGEIECADGICTEYEGGVPTGYASLEAWYAEEAEQLHRWKVVDGQLTLDERAVAQKSLSILDLIYPVGSVYISVCPTSPADLFGGTWEPIKDRFLLAADLFEAGELGGEADHTLTVSEMPAHSHGLRLQGGALSGGSDYSRVASNVDPVGGVVGSTGGSQPHNNMPPYLAVYMWRRIDNPTGGLPAPDNQAANVWLSVHGEASITDDGAGNVAITAPDAIVDDGAGNVTIL